MEFSSKIVNKDNNAGTIDFISCQILAIYNLRKKFIFKIFFFNLKDADNQINH